MELTASMSIIIISVLVIIILIFLTVLILIVRKNGGKATASISDGKRSFSFGLDTGENKNSTSNTNSAKNDSHKLDVTSQNSIGPVVDKSAVNSQTKELVRVDLTKTHKFFASTAKRYTTVFHSFSIYDKLCSKDIKRDSPEVMVFKKTIAGKYLHECLFKYFCDSLTEWIDAMKQECLDRISSGSVEDHAPSSYFSCLDNFLRYKEETARLARNIDFTFNDKQIHGIPDNFIEVLNDWSMKNISAVSSALNILLFSASDNNWLAHVKEILDVYDGVFALMLNDIDATLIILNGEMRAYVEKLMST